MDNKTNTMLNKEEVWDLLLSKYRENIECAERKEFLKYIVYGIPNPTPPNTMIKLEDGTLKFESLTEKQVVEKYGYLLTEEEKEKLLK